MSSEPTRQRPSGPPTYSSSTPSSNDGPPSSSSLPSRPSSSSTSAPPFLRHSPSLPSPPESDWAIPVIPLAEDPSSPTCYHRHLPHQVASASASGLTPNKPSSQLVLSQNLVFLSPPKEDAFGLSLGDGEATGKDARINGFLNVFSPQRKHVKGISITLVGSQRLIFPATATTPRASLDEDFLTEEIVYEGDGADKEKGIWLEKGVISFEFSFNLPSTSPPSAKSESGWSRYHVRSKVMGSGGFFQSDLADEKRMVVTCLPPQDDNVVIFQHRSEADHPQLGPLSLTLSSNQFTVGGGLVVSLAFAAPPPSLAVFTISAYIIETSHITSCKDPSRTGTHVSARKLIVREGPGSGWSSPSFAERAREREGGVLLDGKKVGLQDGEVWNWMKAGRLSDENHLSPSTLPGTKSSFHHSTELVVEVIFNQQGEGIEDERVKVATLFSRPVLIASCGCMVRQLSLPNYAEDLPQGSRLKPHLPPGWFECMCDIPWEVLEKQELELARRGVEVRAEGREEGRARAAEGTKVLSRREGRSND